MTLEEQLEEQIKSKEKEILELQKKVSSLEEEARGKESEIEFKDAAIKAKNEEIESKEATIAKKEQQITHLTQRLDWLLKKVFGRMSEKKHLPLDPTVIDEPTLFPDAMTEAEKAALAEDVKKSEETISKSIATKEKPSRKPLDINNLHVEETHIYPEGTTDESGKLKEEYTEIGTEVSDRLERIPAKAYINRIIRHKVILKAEIRNNFPEERSILIAPLPLSPINRGIPGASVLTDIIISKFMYYLPFYRIINQYKESGAAISSSTINGWYEASIEKLKLLYGLLRYQVMSSEYLQVDESMVPVIDNDKHETRKGYLWCVRDALSGALYFYYDQGSRAYRVATDLLESYHGAIQSDGYEAYDQFEDKKDKRLLACWAHARRKFVDALKEDNRRATEAIVYIKKLYAVESKADELSLTPEQRSGSRVKEAYPVLLEFEKWLIDNYDKVLPQSNIGKAIGYTYALMPRLSRYVNDGRLEIDNNKIENAIRPLAIGRKNWLFCGNDASAYRAAIVYSLIGTCKAANVEPREWMEDVLERIPYYQRGGKDMTELLPAAWQSSKTKSN